jgi:LmbE family N-acetylglucosaminyl deacetylase
VIYDEGGIYGHPDHLAVSRVGRRAAELASIPTLYEATVDREYLHFVETHLAEQARTAVPDHYKLGVPTVMVSTTIDVRPFLERKRLAIAAHSSQVPETSFAMTMPHGSFAEVYGFEWYVRTGPAGVIDELGF